MVAMILQELKIAHFLPTNHDEDNKPQQRFFKHLRGSDDDILKFQMKQKAAARLFPVLLSCNWALILVLASCYTEWSWKIQSSFALLTFMDSLVEFSMIKLVDYLCLNKYV